MIKIYKAESSDDLRIIKELFEEYIESLNLNLDFQDVLTELSTLPGKYSHPEGILLFLTWNSEIAGCVALRKQEEDICEMKRLYIRPKFRKKGLGLLLAQEVIKIASDLNYHKMRLDTIDNMDAANNLYKKLGFRQISAYYFNPLSGVVYYELEL